MEWNRGEIIGRGTTATVSIATSAATGEVFAVKSANLFLSSFLQREKDILSKLSSPYIIQYRGDQITYENNTYIYNLLMEYAPRGSISDMIKKTGGPIDESTIRVFAHQILSGLKYLHNNGIVHCDIKGQNVLIGKEGVKIADLGCAKGVAMSAFSGTPAYMAPEVARGEEQSFSADVWAFGCTVIEMATGSHPFPKEENPVSVLYSVGFSGYTPEIPMSLSEECRDFLDKCLERDSKKRWTAKELLGHAFFDDLELNSKNFDECTRVSPTSVLEQGFWDFVDAPESSQNSVDFSSPADRIKGLVGISNSSVPNWDFEEDWISVRINENEENITDDVQIESIIVESETFGSLSFDTIDTMPEYSDDVATEFDSFSVLRNTDMLCENVLDNTIYVSLGLQRNLMKIRLLFNSSVLRPLLLLCLSSMLFLTSKSFKTNFFRCIIDELSRSENGPNRKNLIN